MAGNVMSEYALVGQANQARRQQRRRRLIDGARRVVLHGILIFFALVFILPLYWMVTSALKPNDELFLIPPKWFPSDLLWHHFADVFDHLPFVRYTWNTVYICIYNVVATLISCTLVAYGFARLEWIGRNFFFGLVLATMMLPHQVTLIPQYLIFSDLGWVGTTLPLTFPAWFGTPFFIFLMRQFFLTIPSDLTDSARIDGAGHLRILWDILVPLSKPVLATTAVFTFLWNWNDFFWPLIYLTSQDQYTLALGLYNFVGGVARTEWGLLLSAASMMTIPPVVLFFFAQRSFIEGISMTGSKQ